MPAAPCPIGTRFTSLRVDPSSTTKSGPPNVETNTNFPSGVNFKRFAPRTFTFSVCTTFLAARSMTEMVPSCALAAQISFPSGETSKPSEPLPTGITVSVQLVRGAGLGAAPAGGGGPAELSAFSMTVTVAEFTLEVTMGFRLGKRRSCGCDPGQCQGSSRFVLSKGRNCRQLWSLRR